MSLVTVHGPNTMYTTGAGTPINSSPPGATATQSPTNGLSFAFNFPNPGARPNGDFSWAFTGPGSPAAQPGVKSGTVVFTGPGAGTIVCTVAAGAGPPAGGTYTTSVTAVAGAPRDVGPEQAEAPAALAAPPAEEDTSREPTPEVDVGYDPGAHTVAEVIAYAEDHPDQVTDLLEAEEAGKNRSTLISHLESLL